jgi:hypothetical protein
MPLAQGNSNAAVSHNIEVEKAAGKPQAQAVAIALHTARDDTMQNKDAVPTYNPGNAPITKDQANYKSVLPETVTQAELNEQNKRFWQQPAAVGPDFGNGKPGS